MEVVIIQARMGSTRLPGKVLKQLGSKTQLGQLLHRIKPAKVDKIIVATSDLEQDTPIFELCQSLNVECFRGSEQDVLSRYYHAAAKYAADQPTVIRLTGDCPLHHYQVVDFAIETFKTHQLDFFSNSYAPHFEDGFDVEVFSWETLQKAHQQATLAADREHVTFYMRDAGKFLCGYKKFIPEYKQKLSVDSPEDFQMATAIFDHFGSDEYFSMKQVVELLKEQPELLNLNASSEVNAGHKQWTNGPELF